MTETKHPTPETISNFRALGILTLLSGVLCLFLWVINMEARKHGRHDLSFAIYFSVYLIPVGIGTLSLRRIFAIGIALPTLLMALWLTIGSIIKVPFPWMLINIAFASVLFIPSYLVVKSWGELK